MMFYIISKKIKDQYDLLLSNKNELINEIKYAWSKNIQG